MSEQYAQLLLLNTTLCAEVVRLYWSTMQPQTLHFRDVS